MLDEIAVKLFYLNVLAINVRGGNSKSIAHFIQFDRYHIISNS